MIVVTGAAGFIGSCLVSALIRTGYKDVVVVDDFSNSQKNKNLQGKEFIQRVDRDDFFNWLDENQKRVYFIFHIGARTDTTEFDETIFKRLNVDYSKTMWNKCVQHGIPLVYASSAATYGLGEHGYIDSHEVVKELAPLNPYGNSKNEFDKWALAQKEQPYFWAGLKFFNVYGPNEYHKGRMASVIFHAFGQISENGRMKLFRSHNPDFEHGRQLRDFVYVKDVMDVCVFLLENRQHSGLYNIGTGQARTFIDLARAVFKSLDKKEDIKFIDTPADIRDKYQYFTEARMEKLRNAGYQKPFTSLESGVADYVENYLVPQSYY